MSGGGGGGGGDYGPSDGPALDCSQVDFTTTLTSPDPDVVAELEVGELLEVRVDNSGGPAVIQAVRSNGEVAGSLIEQVTTLLRCLQSGVAFEAEVLEIDGGSVRVNVRAA